MYEELLLKILEVFKEQNTEFLYKMIESMQTAGILTDPRVIQALQHIRIEDFITMDMIRTFIPDELLHTKRIDSNLLNTILLQLFMGFYGNRPLPFYNHPKYGRSTGAPHMIAIMAQLIDIEEGDKLLVLGSKSGYLECIIQEMDNDTELFIVEKVAKIYEITKFNIDRVHLTDKVHIFNMDPLLSLDKLPIHQFDKIFITGYMPKITQPLLDLIKIGGLICCPIGDPNVQSLIRYFKTGAEIYDEEDCMQVIFSPLITDYKF
jgi:protein-L-isoaspartate(D-aspartate) O-methyltransferase